MDLGASRPSAASAFEDSELHATSDAALFVRKTGYIQSRSKR